MSAETAAEGPIAQEMRRKIEAQFAPRLLELVDDSARHRHHEHRHGHTGDRRHAAETHFQMRIVSEAFAGLNRVARQRAVHAALAEELADRVHALTLRLETPEEAA